MQKNEFLKVKNSFLELESDFIELKDSELKDREVEIKIETELQNNRWILNLTWGI